MSCTILVFVKQVPDTKNVTGDAMKPDGTINRQALPAIFNPEDLNALELALQLKDRYGAKVIVATMGLPAAAGILRDSLFRGADETVLLTDRALGGSDTLATSFALSRLAKKVEHFDLVLCGRQAIDGDTAQVGPQIAEHLHTPMISYVAGVEFDGKDKLTVKKEDEDGYQMLEVHTPALLTVLASAFKPRYMTVKGILDAYDEKEIEIWNVDKIDVEEAKLGLNGSPTRVKRSFTKPQKVAGEVFDVTPEEAVDLIVAKLKEKFII